MVDIQTLSFILTGIGIIGAIIYYTLTLRNANKTRQAQLFMEIYQQYSSEDVQKTFIDLLHLEWTARAREQRQIYNVPDRFTGFEYLAEEMKKMKEKRGYTVTVPKSYDRYIEDK